jgi:hypothetical protein
VRYLEPGRGRPRGRLTLTQRLWWVVGVLAVVLAAATVVQFF